MKKKKQRKESEEEKEDSIAWFPWMDDYCFSLSFSISVTSDCRRKKTLYYYDFVMFFSLASVGKSSKLNETNLIVFERKLILSLKLILIEIKIYNFFFNF